MTEARSVERFVPHSVNETTREIYCMFGKSENTEAETWKCCTHTFILHVGLDNGNGVYELYRERRGFTNGLVSNQTLIIRGLNDCSSCSW